MYGQPDSHGGPPSYPSSGSVGGRQSMVWIFSAVVVVAVAAVVITLVLTGGSGSSQAGGTGTPTPNRSTTHSTTEQSSSPSPSITAPTTDALPDNAEAAVCSKSVGPQYVALAVVTVVSEAKGDSLGSYGTQVLEDCSSAAVRSRLSQLYGVGFGYTYSGDLTGGQNAGPVAKYSVKNAKGTATLTLTLTRQQDGHYELTDFTYG